MFLIQSRVGEALHGFKNFVMPEGPSGLSFKISTEIRHMYMGNTYLGRISYIFMKLNKKQKEVLLENVKATAKEKGDKGHIFWEAGDARYNIGMNKVWSKEQKQEIDGINSRLDRLETKVDSIEDNIKLVIDILGRNGMK